MVQVEAHPYFPQTELKKVLAETGIGLMAWYPLGHGDKSLIQEPIFTELAAKYGKTNTHMGSGDGGTYDTIRQLESDTRVLTGLPKMNTIPYTSLNQRQYPPTIP